MSDLTILEEFLIILFAFAALFCVILALLVHTHMNPPPVYYTEMDLKGSMYTPSIPEGMDVTATFRKYPLTEAADRYTIQQFNDGIRGEYGFVLKVYKENKRIAYLIRYYSLHGEPFELSIADVELAFYKFLDENNMLAKDTDELVYKQPFGGSPIHLEKPHQTHSDS